MPALKGFWNSFSSQALDWLYPRKCGLCGLFADKAICQTCLGEFGILDAFPQTEADSAIAYRSILFPYHGRPAQAVRRLKYSRITPLAHEMSQLLRQAYDEHGHDEVDLIVPIPIHWTRRCARGFNQAEMLCESLPQEKLATSLLHRIKATRPQVGLTRAERLRNLTGAFRAVPEVKGRGILLVDDVVTSGQTANACASVLLQAGAEEVGILAFCGEIPKFPLL